MRNLLFIFALLIWTTAQAMPDWYYVTYVNSSLFITDRYTGYYHYDEKLGSHGAIYYLRKSTDGMNTFSTIRSNYGMWGCCTLDAIYFCDKDTGFIAELDKGISYVYRTINGGLTWQNLYFYGIWDNRLYFLNKDFGFISFGLGPFGSSILQRYENGNDTIIMNTPDYDLAASKTKIYFLNLTTGFIVTKNYLNQGVILKTINSGDNWYEVDIYDNNLFKDICFISDSTGFVIGTNGLILKTNNIGENWIEVSTNYSETLNSISFSDTYNGYIVGDNGLILKSSDGGNFWNIIDFINSDNLIYTKSVGNEDCYVLSENGYLYRNFILTEINDDNAIDNIVIAPVPANDYFKIILPPEIQDFTVNIYNNSGRILFTAKNTKTINNNFPKGFYLIEIISKNKIYRNKLLIN